MTTKVIKDRYALRKEINEYLDQFDYEDEMFRNPYSSQLRGEDDYGKENFVVNPTERQSIGATTLTNVYYKYLFSIDSDIDDDHTQPYVSRLDQDTEKSSCSAGNDHQDAQPLATA